MKFNDEQKSKIIDWLLGGVSIEEIVHRFAFVGFKVTAKEIAEIQLNYYENETFK